MWLRKPEDGRLLFAVNAADPSIWLAVTGILTAVALLACAVPTRRAIRLDPLRALRYD